MEIVDSTEPVATQEVVASSVVFSKKLRNVDFIYGNKNPIKNDAGEVIGQRFDLVNPFLHALQVLFQCKTESIETASKLSKMYLMITEKRQLVEKIFNDIRMEYIPKSEEEAASWVPQNDPRIIEFLNQEIELHFTDKLLMSDIKVGIGPNKYMAFSAEEMSDIAGLLEL